MDKRNEWVVYPYLNKRSDGDGDWHGGRGTQ